MCGLLRVEEALLIAGLNPFGVDAFGQPASDQGQLGRVEGLAVPDHQRLTGGSELGADIGGEIAHRADDHPRLRHTHIAGGQGGTGGLEAAPQRSRVLHQNSGVGRVDLMGAGQPRPGRGRPLRLGEPAGLELTYSGEQDGFGLRLDPQCCLDPVGDLGVGLGPESFLARLAQSRRGLVQDREPGWRQQRTHT